MFLVHGNVVKVFIFYWFFFFDVYVYFHLNLFLESIMYLFSFQVFLIWRIWGGFESNQIQIKISRVELSDAFLHLFQWLTFFSDIIIHHSSQSEFKLEFELIVLDLSESQTYPCSDLVLFESNLNTDIRIDGVS